MEKQIYLNNGFCSLDKRRSATEYQAISCDFYDQLINTITLKQNVIINLENEKIDGMIEDVFTKNKEEWCKISGRLIRLDEIISMEV